MQVRLSSAAGEALLVVRIAAVEPSGLRIGAKRARIVREHPARSNHTVRRLSLLNPLLDCIQHIEMVCRLSAALKQQAQSAGYKSHDRLVKKYVTDL